MRVKKLLKKLQNAGFTGEISIENRNYEIEKKQVMVKSRVLLYLTAAALVVLIFAAKLYIESGIEPFEIETENTEYKKRYNPLKKIDLNRLIINGKTGKIKRLLERFEYIEKADKYGWTPLHWAVLLDQEEIIKLLLKKGADPGRRSKREWYIYPEGTRPIDIAEINGNKKIKKIIESAQKRNKNNR